MFCKYYNATIALSMLTSYTEGQFIEAVGANSSEYASFKSSVLPVLNSISEFQAWIVTGKPMGIEQKRMMSNLTLEDIELHFNESTIRELSKIPAA